MGITIMINEETWKYLVYKKKRNESFAELLDRLLINKQKGAKNEKSN